MISGESDKERAYEKVTAELKQRIQKMLEEMIGSDVWEWSSVMRSLGCSPSERHWTTRAYPSHYRFAVAQTEIHIQPQIPLSGYVPGAAAVERLIAKGERATYQALESLSKAHAA